MSKIIVGISGASGITLAHRAIEALTRLDHCIELIMTKDAAVTALDEMGPSFASVEKFVNSFSRQELITYHKIHNFNAPIASGSYPVDGMMIIPCSMATLAAVAVGLSDNLLRRAADVTIKERRPLIVVPRESPFSEIHLENMLRITRMGGVIVPPIPAWYTHPKCLEDIENFIVGRILDAFKIDANLYSRWGHKS